jgi:hypothetical protein
VKRGEDMGDLVVKKKNNIKMDLNKIEWEVVNWIHLP